MSVHISFTQSDNNAFNNSLDKAIERESIRTKNHPFREVYLLVQDNTGDEVFLGAIIPHWEDAYYSFPDGISVDDAKNDITKYCKKDNLSVSFLTKEEYDKVLGE